MKRKRACILALVLAFAMTGAALASVEQPDDDFYYIDTADVLNSETEGTIYFCNKALEEQTGAQIVVAALDNLDGEDTYDYAYEMFNQWGIGSAEENNGFLLLMAIQEDDYYALTGPAVEGIFSSSELNKLFDEYLESDFAAKDYDAGALKFFGAVLDKYADYYNIDLDLAYGREQAQAYLAQAAGTGNFGGARSGGGAYQPEYDYYEDDDVSDFEEWLVAVITFIIIFAIINALGRRRRGPGRPVVFFGAPWHRPPHPHHPHHEPPHHGDPGGHRPSGGFGGGAGRSSGGFGGAGRSSGGFGGSHGGGGRSFGGGAGRGRH